ncbi:MAG: PIN domain-containing protein [Bifidobacteriaceae bacterium]|jgi:predicted nucleic acid-binding protein|nr:PIN domain-containing protein [Bifidobacteriaceae bacterium]
MIGYFDTSAVVPLVVNEPASGRCAALWQACDVRISCLLVVAEAHAALAQALRLGRLDQERHSAAVELLGLRLGELDLLTPTRELVDTAAGLALSQALRGHDAIHAAAALALAGPDLVVVACGQDLRRACAALGLATADPSHADVGEAAAPG